MRVYEYEHMFQRMISTKGETMKTLNVEELMKKYQVPGVSIAFIQNGKLSETRSNGFLENADVKRPVMSDSIYNACSISKLVTAMLALKLVDDGFIDLDEDINHHLVSWKVHGNDFGKNVTLRTLLSHQSGFIDPDGSFSEFNISQGSSSMLEVLEGKSPYCKEPIMLKYEPATEFHYSDTGFCVIQQLIEDMTGKRFTDVTKEMIFTPLHMKNSRYINTLAEVDSNLMACGHDRTGNVVDGKFPLYPFPAASGLWSTPTDIAQIVIEIINSLYGEGKLGVSDVLIKEMITPQGCSAWTGLGVFLDTTGKNLEISSLGWGVGFQCLMVAYPDLGTGVVIMTNCDLGVHQMKGLIGELVQSLTPELQLYDI